MSCEWDGAWVRLNLDWESEIGYGTGNGVVVGPCFLGLHVLRCAASRYAHHWSGTILGM